MESKNRISVIEKRFDRFDLLYFENGNDTDDAFYQVYKVTDTIYAKNKNEFKALIEFISVKRMEYLNFWREYAKQDVLAVYDEIIEKHLDIEREIQCVNENTCFIIRRNDLAVNYLNEVDLNIGLNRISESNFIFTEKKLDNLSSALDERFSILKRLVCIKQFIQGYPKII